MEEKRISVSISLTAETYKKISADMEKEDASVSDIAGRIVDGICGLSEDMKDALNKFCHNQSIKLLLESEFYSTEVHQKICRNIAEQWEKLGEIFYLGIDTREKDPMRKLPIINGICVAPRRFHCLNPEGVEDARSAYIVNKKGLETYCLVFSSEPYEDCYIPTLTKRQQRKIDKAYMSLFQRDV